MYRPSSRSAADREAEYRNRTATVFCHGFDHRPCGIVGLDFTPHSSDEKRYVYTQVRESSVLSRHWAEIAREGARHRTREFEWSTKS